MGLGNGRREDRRRRDRPGGRGSQRLLGDRSRAEIVRFSPDAAATDLAGAAHYGYSETTP